MTPQDRLRHHVTGAIERGEKEAITEQPASQEHDTLKNYRLYGKGPGMKQFKAMNWKDGAPVGNLIFATIFFDQEATRAYHEASSLNPDWEFKLVQC